MDKLKPCPFCGGEAVVFVPEEGGVMVVCRVCRARTAPKVDEWYIERPTKSVQSVIEAWNRRHNG